MCIINSNNLIDVQVSELTEKARTDSTGRPGDPHFKFLENAKMQSDSQKKMFSIAKYNFCDPRNITGWKSKTLLSSIKNKF